MFTSVVQELSVNRSCRWIASKIWCCVPLPRYCI